LLIRATVPRLAASHLQGKAKTGLRGPQRNVSLDNANVTPLRTRLRSPRPVEHAEFVNHLRSETGSLENMLAGADSESLENRVPAISEWSVMDLTEHLAQTHRWAAACLRTGEKTPGIDGRFDRRDPVGSYRSAADDVLDAVRSIDPMRPTWHFGPRPKLAGFWARREAHETAVHRMDLGGALGVPVALDRALAADGVDEVLEVFFPRQVAHGRQEPLPFAVRLVVTDDPQAKIRTLHGDGIPPGPDEIDATLTGSAQAVLLALWGRLALDDPRLSISGALDALRAVFAAHLTP
jgi:uncharacterized protein (TIGR03083 family)